MLQSKGGVPGVGSNQLGSASGNDDKQLPQLEDDDDEEGFENGMEDDEAELVSDPRNSGGKQMRRGRSNSDHRAPNN